MSAAEVTMERRSFCRAAAQLLGVAAIPAARAAPGPAARGLDDIAGFRAGLHGQLLLAGDDGYDTARRLWNGAFDRRPALIARCADAADVARSIGFARAHDLLLAVRGGGHSFPGHSSCDGGLMIDLSSMRAVEVDGQRIRVGPGVLLGELDRAAFAAGRVTSTGSVSHTGIAGLALGGGFGRLARKLGLACDNLLAAEVVTADGRQLRADSRENPDLFWGLRGGGGNFGVVTAFEFRLHPAPASTIGGSLAFPLVKPRELLRAYADFCAQASDEFSAMLDIVPTPEGRIALLEICHCGARAAAERELATLRTIGTVAQDSLRPTPYIELQSRIDNDYPAGRGYYLKSGFVREMTPELIDAVVDFLEAAPAPRCIASFLQLGGAIARVAPEATAYWHRAARHQVLLAGFWDAPADADAPREWVKRGWKTLEPRTDGFYVNLAGPDESAQRIRNTYGGNYERLATLKRRYDPTNLFRLNANIPT
jgi:FAD binding domain-containing protein/berberine-like enzyme